MLVDRLPGKHPRTTLTLVSGKLLSWTAIYHYGICLLTLNGRI
jgi:hypothetical protein